MIDHPQAGNPDTSGLHRIAMLSTGGTIASIPGHDGRAVAGVLPGEVLLSHTELHGRMHVEVESVIQKPSNAIDASDWRLLASRCAELAASGNVDGIVLTHGTDTLEDTAFYLHCVADTSQVPIVVTGSQRVPQAIGSDAYVNLRHALELAACDYARGLGVMVAFNESVYSAGFVRKVSSYQLHGFDAPGMGPMGLLDHGSFHLLQRPMLLPLLPNPAELPRIDVLPAYGGASTALLEAVIRSSPAGLVIDGLGRGQVPPGWMPPLCDAMAGGMMVAVCSSTLHGATHESYEYTGALHELVEAGALAVSHLSARKTRIRLALAMAAGARTAASAMDAFSWHPDSFPNRERQGNTCPHSRLQSYPEMALARR
jgi:L-asparaginase